LSYTFHLRRHSKRAKATGRSHNLPLQAMAIRDQKVYVLDPPELTLADTLVFIDIEGDPDSRFVYLIGMLVVRDGQETYQSFWVDIRHDVTEIFEQLDCAIFAVAAAILFIYGCY